MPRRWSVHAIALSAAVFPSCSSSADEPAPVVALYDGAAAMAPFPSDHFLVGGHVVLGPAAHGDPLLRAYRRTVPELEELDGFATSSGAFFRFSDEIDASDPTSLAQAIVFVDVDRQERVPASVRYASWHEDGRAVAPDFTVFVEPSAPLAPKTRHLVVVLDELRSKSGAPVRAAPATRALLGGDAEGAYGTAVRAALAASGLASEHVVAATMFTTAAVHDAMATVAKTIREGPPPAASALIVDKRATAPGDERVRFWGTFAAPEHRAPRPDGRWSVRDGAPVTRSIAQLEYFLTFTHPERPGPKPIVVFGHGLGRDKDMSWEIAEYLAELDVAIVAIDAPEHGSRHDPPFPPGGTDQVSSTLDFIGVDLDTRSIDVGLARDDFRQLASDQLHLFRLVSAMTTLDVLPAGAPDGAPDVDPSRLLYMGVSFGAVIGSTVLAFVPEVRAASLTAGGAPLGTVLRDSQMLRLLVNNILPEDASETDFARFIVVAQSIADPGDPASYAAFVAREPFPGITGWRGADVLAQEAVGDGIIPNSATAALARALGLAQVEPVIDPVPGLVRVASPLDSRGSQPVRGLLQLDRADGQPVSHTTFYATAEVRRQYVDFFKSALASPRATIR
jgi:hypothetical protein